MTLQLNQSVTTPNGAGIYQGRMYSEGQVYALVSHAKTAAIDFNLCQGYQGGSVWWLCTYEISKVEAK